MELKKYNKEILWSSYINCIDNIRNYSTKTLLMDFDIKDTDENIAVYESFFRFMPHRIITLENFNENSFSPNPTNDDFMGDIYVKFSNYILLAALVHTRNHLFTNLTQIICNVDKGALFNEMTMSIKEEIRDIIKIWKFYDCHEIEEKYLDMITTPLTERDIVMLQTTFSFLLVHEIGHFYYNLFKKDCYNSTFTDPVSTGITDIINRIKSIEESKGIFFPRSEDTTEDWIEEYYADIFSYLHSSSVLNGICDAEPFYLSIYGMCINYIVTELSSSFSDDYNDTHPSPTLRINMMKEYIVFVNSGNYPEYFNKSYSIIETNIAFFNKIVDFMEEQK